MIILNSQSVYSQTKDGWKNLKYALFFTNGDVHRLLSDEESFKKTMQYFAPIKIQKVYLEGKNRGEEDVDLMKTVADRFRKIGITAVGAMVPTSEKGGPCCYNDPNDLAFAIERFFNMSPDRKFAKAHRLRAYTVDQHSIQLLVQKVIASIPV